MHVSLYVCEGNFNIVGNKWLVMPSIFFVFIIPLIH